MSSERIAERARLVARYRELSRLLANELEPESVAAPLRREREKVQEAIDVIDAEKAR